MEHFFFWAVTLGIPGIMWIVNLVMREMDAVRTAGADWMLLLMTFDFAGAASSSDLAKQVVTLGFQPFTGLWLLICALALMPCWMFSVRYLEPFVLKKHKTGASVLEQLRWYGLGWVVVITFTAMNLYIFFFAGSKI